MGRLIDADLLKDNIIKCLKPLDPEEEMIDSNVALLSTIMEIDNQPTAFDVDKVVEQLEEVEKIMTSPVTEDCFGEECRASDCTVYLSSKASEIVEGGGGECNMQKRCILIARFLQGIWMVRNQI